MRLRRSRFGNDRWDTSVVRAASRPGSSSTCASAAHHGPKMKRHLCKTRKTLPKRFKDLFIHSARARHLTLIATPGLLFWLVITSKVLRVQCLNPPLCVCIKPQPQAIILPLECAIGSLRYFLSLTLLSRSMKSAPATDEHVHILPHAKIGIVA